MAEWTLGGALLRDPLLGHMRDNQILEKRRGFVAVLCVLAVAGLCVWGLGRET